MPCALRINATSYSRYCDPQHATRGSTSSMQMLLDRATTLSGSCARVKRSSHNRASELPRRKCDVPTGVTAGVVLEVLAGVTPGAVLYALGTARHLQSSAYRTTARYVRCSTSPVCPSNVAGPVSERRSRRERSAVARFSDLKSFGPCG